MSTGGLKIMDLKEAIYTRRPIRAYEGKPVDRALVQN